MAKDTPFFKFDSSAWLAGTIQFTDLECKGLFIDLCAIYWESKKPIKIDTKLKVRTRCVEGTLTDLINTLSDLDIIAQSEHGITIPFLDYLRKERDNFRKKCSEAGKKSAAVKGTLKVPQPNKKEERREKKEERRKENKERESARVFFDGSVKDIFEEHNALEEYDKFCEYWFSLNQLTDKMRWQEDVYFNPAAKAHSWLDKAGVFDKDHIHQEFIDLWIIKTSPTQNRINAVKSYLAGKKDLKTADIIQKFKKDITQDLEKIIFSLERSTNNPRNDALQSFEIEGKKELTSEDLQGMRKFMSDADISEKFPELIGKLKEADNTT